jgi:PBP1b-binding outer membrane lipoprotein LpoB
MALFKCKRSGTVVEFTAQHDIDTMMEHHEYEFVDTSVVVEDVKEDGTRHTITLKKPMGRPRKERL